MLLALSCAYALSVNAIPEEAWLELDLRSEAGAHVRPTTELRDALAYVGKTERRYTNILLYSSG